VTNATGEPPGTSSAWRRMIGVFVAPGPVYDELRERPTWVAPFLVLLVATFALALVVPTELIRDVILREMGPSATPEAVDRAMAWARISRFAGALLGPVFGILVVSTALYVAFTLLAGGAARFRHYWAGTCHAFLIQVLGSFITTPIAVAQGDLETRLSFALLVPGLDSGFGFELLNRITLFGLWTSVVLGLGSARMNRTSPKAGVSIVLALYLLTALVGTGVASLSRR
jgi:hypothetical protein